VENVRRRWTTDKDTSGVIAGINKNAGEGWAYFEPGLRKRLGCCAGSG
jgi:hypothetical protein